MKLTHAVLYVVTSALVVVLYSENTSAHEVRPAYFEVDERTGNCFDVLWKQPTGVGASFNLEPTMSSGLIEAPVDETYSGNGFAIRRWKGQCLAGGSLEGTEVGVRGLEFTLTDVLVNVRLRNGQQIQAILTSGEPTLSIHFSSATRAGTPMYLALGVRHILGGFDHLSFVLCLVLIVRNSLLLLKTITAFTVSHSITLAAAVLGYVTVYPAAIEALVALSIVFVAGELSRSSCGIEGITMRCPWLVALLFGLLHGFAFAGSLSKIGLPQENIPSALLLFNCGVEIGQLLFVAIILAAISLFKRLPSFFHPTFWRPLVAYGVGTLASYWLLDRVCAPLMY